MRPVIRSEGAQIRPADLDRLAAVLKRGGVVLAGVDTVYGLIGKAFDDSVLERLDTLKGSRTMPYAAAFASGEQLTEWHSRIDLLQARLIRTLLPGPVTLLLPCDAKAYSRYRYNNGKIGVRVSSDPTLRALCDGVGAPLWATSANHSGEPAPVRFEQIAPQLVKSVDIAVDNGPTAYRAASTVIDATHFPYTIHREGAFLQRAQRAVNDARRPLKVLVLCTGNICRSPLAEHLLRRELSPASSAAIEISSAGISAVPGLSASAGMVAWAAGKALDLSGHKSRAMDSQMLLEADLILCAAPVHLQAAVMMQPKSASKAHLLGEVVNISEVPDPYELDAGAYRRTAELIEEACRNWARWILERLPKQFNAEV